MRSDIDLTLELLSSVATLRLSGAINHADVSAGARVLLALPPAISTLRIDMRQLADISESAGSALRSLIRQWRQVRRGLVDIIAEQPALELLADALVRNSPPRATVSGTTAPDAALTGAFL